MRTARKASPETDVDPLAPSAEFLAATARWSEASAKHAELIDAIDGRKLALSLALHPEDADRVPAHLREKAEPYRRVAQRRRDRVISDLADAEIELAEYKPTFQAEHEAYQAALRHETNRLSAILQPQHREAVVAIGAALEQLSRAIVAEREVRADLARIAPLPTSANLPDLSGDLQVGCLGDWQSPAWEWRRRCHQIGVFK